MLPWRCSSLKSAENLRAGLRIEGAGRLVREKKGRLVREGARNRDPLVLAARELRGKDVGLLGDADLLEQLEGAVAALPARDAGVAGAGARRSGRSTPSAGGCSSGRRSRSSRSGSARGRRPRDPATGTAVERVRARRG